MISSTVGRLIFFERVGRNSSLWERDVPSCRFPKFIAKAICTVQPINAVNKIRNKSKLPQLAAVDWARNKGKRRGYSSSPTRKHPSTATSSGAAPTTPPGRSGSPSSATQFVTEDDELAYFRDPTISPPDKFSNPRSFPYSVKQQCWEKAEKIKGRDPDRWRPDPLGNTIFRNLVGCLCHDYDHIIPYSKGGQSTLENCQVLQATVNRSKGNRTEMSRADLIQKSSYCRVSGRDMDLLELSAHGNVRRGQDSRGCIMQ